MSIETDARREPSEDVPTSSNGQWIICGDDWVPERIYRRLVDLQADREPSDAEVRRAAHAMAAWKKDRTGAPAMIDYDMARAALLAAQEVRRG